MQMARVGGGSERRLEVIVQDMDMASFYVHFELFMLAMITVVGCRWHFHF